MKIAGEDRRPPLRNPSLLSHVGLWLEGGVLGTAGVNPAYSSTLEI
jgi:hypothetical protein